MDELERWMKNNQKLCVVTGIFGLLVSPFLWPFFLAVIFQSLSLAVPIILAWLLIRQPWKEKENQNEESFQREQHGKSTDTAEIHPDGASPDDMPENRAETGQDPLRGQAKKKKAEPPDGETCLALLWYQKEGRDRFLHLKEKQGKEGKREFSISKDGICSVRRGNGFQRVGVLRGYPGKRILKVEKEMKKDGFSLKEAGDYIWVSWEKEE